MNPRSKTSVPFVMRRLCAALACSATLFVAMSVAHAEPIAPPPWHAPAGTLRVWGTPRAAEILSRWQHGYRARDRGTRIIVHLSGTDIGMAALYTGQADIVLSGREATDSEIKAFEWIFHYRPTRIEIATGSLDGAGRSPALAVFVHRDNPLARIDFAQLASVFGVSAASGDQNIRTWNRLGIEREWSGRPIHLYAPDSESGSGTFFRARVLNGASKMNWEHLDEFAEPSMSTDISGRAILHALAKDRYGMAITDLAHANAGVKVVALKSGGDFVLPTRATLVDGTYPLRRALYAYINVPEHAVPDAVVARFLDYVLGTKGQHALDMRQGYLPLSDETAQRERHVLGEASR